MAELGGAKSKKFTQMHTFRPKAEALRLIALRGRLVEIVDLQHPAGDRPSGGDDTDRSGFSSLR